MQVARKLPSSETLEVQPPSFIGWFPNHNYFSRGLSSSKRNHHFINGGWLPGDRKVYIYTCFSLQKEKYLFHDTKSRLRKPSKPGKVLQKLLHTLMIHDWQSGWILKWNVDEKKLGISNPPYFLTEFLHEDVLYPQMNMVVDEKSAARKLPTKLTWNLTWSQSNPLCWIFLKHVVQPMTYTRSKFLFKKICLSLMNILFFNKTSIVFLLLKKRLTLTRQKAIAYD